MKTIKGIFAIAAVLFLASCTHEPTESYSLNEMKVLVSMGEAAFSNDSIEFYNSSIEKMDTLPIAQVETFGYQPAMNANEEVRYFVVKK